MLSDHLGLTGTRWLVESEVYPKRLREDGLEYVRRTPPNAKRMNRTIMDKVVFGVFKRETVAYFQQVIGRMNDDGCDAVILGCTEIPSIVARLEFAADARLTRLLAWAALRSAVHAVAPA